jgi:general secretion pathway protein D
MKIVSISALAVAFGLLVPTLSSAQFIGGDTSGDSGSWRDIKFNTKTRIKLDFRNANIDLVISMFQKTSGVTIVKDPALVGPITLTSATSVPLKTGFQILEKTLSLKGFDLKKDGDLLVIQKQQDRGGRGGNNGGMPDIGAIMGAMGGQSNSVLKIYPIKFANATSVARVVNDAFSQTGQNNNPFAAFFGGGQQGGFQGFPGGGGNNQQGTVVRASSDDFSNSVIVNAPDKEQKEVERVIKTIDKETQAPQHTKVYVLQYATAAEVAPTIQNVLTNNAPRGVGGVTNSGTNPQDRFQQALRFGSTQASFGTVAADARTNSLVVTATDESQLICESVIRNLDKSIDFASTTFVFPLNNAKADDVATLLRSAFGTRAGLNGNTARVNTPTVQRQTVNTTGTGGNRVGGSIDNPNDPNNLYLQMQNPNGVDGELMTNIYAQGGGAFGQFGGGQFRGGQGGNNGQNTTPVGRGTDGKLTPIQDLTGQVTAIPDPNTNSIIIVANPDFAALIKSILAQLDKIPEQVMIETIIVEANLDATEKLGVEWNYLDKGALGVSGQNGNVGSNFGINSTTNPPLGFKYTIGGKNLSLFMNALNSDTKFTVLSTPRIFTSNNVQGQINISQSVPYITSTRTDTTGAQTYSYSFVDVGIVLTVTPRITANGYVTMDVNQTANDLVGYTTFNAPIVNKREANTLVSVKSGDTVILGGIIRSSVTATTNKIPILGDIPILGNLFRSTSKSKNKTELMILMRPRIVKDEDEARKLRLDDTKEISKETSDQLNKVIPPESTKVEIKDKKNGGGKQ